METAHTSHMLSGIRPIENDHRTKPSTTTLSDPSLQKSALRRIARQPQRRFEVAARHGALTTPELELTACCRIEGVVAEPFDFGNGGDRCEPFFWAFELCEGHGSV